VWTCQPIGAGKQSAGEAGEGAHAKDAPWKHEDVYSSADDSVGPRPSRAAGGYNGCTGYGNRLAAVATAFLYAVVHMPMTTACVSMRRHASAYVC
jgi:hypothetical protein